MIKELFGQPSLPSEINNCVIFFDNEKFFMVDKIYLFSTIAFLKVIKFGDLYESDVLFNGRRIFGYFSITNKNILRQNKNPYRIIGKSISNIYHIIDGINFLKVNEMYPEYNAEIRFEAMRIKKVF